MYFEIFAKFIHFNSFIHSLVKMIFCYSKKATMIPTLSLIKLAVRRNFSGINEYVDVWNSYFKPELISSLKVKNF